MSKGGNIKVVVRCRPLNSRGNARPFKHGQPKKRAKLLGIRGAGLLTIFFGLLCSFSVEIAKKAECIIHMDGDMTTISKPEGPDGAGGGSKSFSFDHSYWSFDKADPNYAGQQRLYEDLGVELLNHSFNGYNTCIVACKSRPCLKKRFSFFCCHTEDLVNVQEQTRDTFIRWSDWKRQVILHGELTEE